MTSRAAPPVYNNLSSPSPLRTEGRPNTTERTQQQQPPPPDYLRTYLNSPRPTTPTASRTYGATTPGGTTAPRTPTTGGGGGGGSTMLPISYGGSGASRDAITLEARVAVLEQELEGKRKTIAKLESEAILHLRALGDVRSEEDSKRQLQFANLKKEIEGERERVRAMQAELAGEQARRRDLEARCLRMESDAKRVPSLEGRIMELDLVQRDKQQDAVDAARKIQALEQKLLEVQSAGMSRLLEGKVAGLQKLLDDKGRELEEEHRRTQSVEMKNEDLKESLAALQQQIVRIEKENGEKYVEVMERRKENERLELKVRTLEAELEVQISKQVGAEQRALQCEADRDQHDMDLKTELRTKQKALTNLEVDKEMLMNKVRELEMEVSRSKSESERAKAAAEAASRDLLRVRHDIDTLEGNAARENIVAQGLRGQIDRLRTQLEETRKEIHSADQQKIQYENRVHTLEQELRHKTALEEQLRQVQSSYDRTEKDMQAEIRRHDETKSRCLELEEKINRGGWVVQRVKELELELETRNDLLDKARTAMTKKDYTIEEIRRELDREAQRVAQLEGEIQEEAARRTEMELRMSELEQEAIRRATLEGKVVALERMLEDKGKDLVVANNARADVELHVRDLEGQLEIIPTLEARIRDLAQEKFSTEMSFEGLDDKRRELEREITALQTRLGQREQEVDTERAHVIQLEEVVANLRREVAEKPVVESRLTEVELLVKNKEEELVQMQSSLSESNLHLQTLQQALEKEQLRTKALENQLAAEIEVIEAAQLEAGRNAVNLEQAEKDKVKLLKEVEWKQQQAELAQHQSKRLQEELNERVDIITKFEAREAHRAALIDSQTRRIEDLEKDNTTTRAELGCERDKVLLLENRVLQLEADERKCTTLEGKITALESLLANKDSDVTMFQTMNQELKLKVKEMETEVANTQKLDLRIKEMRAQVARQMSTIESVEDESNAKTKILVEREKELQNTKEIVANYLKDLDTAHTNHTSLKHRITTLENELQKQNELLGKIDGLQEVVTARTMELDMERSGAESLRSRIRTLELQLTAHTRLESTIAELESQVKMKNDVISRLEGEEARRRQIVDRLQREVDGLDEGKRALEEENRKNREEYEAISKQHIETQRKLEDRLQDVEAELRSITMDCNKLQVISQDLQDRYLQESAACTRATDRMKHLEEELTSARRHITQLETDAGSRLVTLENLERNWENERANVQHLSHVLMTEREQKAAYESDKKQCEAIIMNLERKLGVDVKNRDLTIERLTDDVNELKKQLAEKTRFLQAKGDEVVIEGAKRNQLEDTLRRLTEELAFTKDQLRISQDAVNNTKKAQQDALDRRNEAANALLDKDKLMQQMDRRLNNSEKRTKEEEMRSAELTRQLRVAQSELSSLREEQAEFRRLAVSENKDHKMKTQSLVDEKELLKTSLQKMKNELAEALRSDADKSSHYESTIQALTQKCYTADETLMKLKDQTGFLETLKTENTKLREQLRVSNAELDSLKEHQLALQRQISATLRK